MHFRGKLALLPFPFKFGGSDIEKPITGQLLSKSVAMTSFSDIANILSEAAE